MNLDEDPNHYRYCPHCGKPLPSGGPLGGANGNRPILIAGIMLLLGVLAFAILYSQLKPQASAPPPTSSVTPPIPPQEDFATVVPPMEETRDRTPREAPPMPEPPPISPPPSLSKPEPELDYEPIEFVNPEEVSVPRGGERRRERSEDPPLSLERPKTKPSVLLAEDFGGPSLNTALWRSEPRSAESSCAPWIAQQFGSLAVGTDEGQTPGNNLSTSLNMETDFVLELDYAVTHFPKYGAAGAYVEIAGRAGDKLVLELNLTSTGEVRALFSLTGPQAAAAGAKLHSMTVSAVGRIRMRQSEGTTTVSCLANTWQTLGAYRNPFPDTLRFSGYASSDCPPFQVVFDNLLIVADTPEGLLLQVEDASKDTSAAAPITIQGRGNGPIQVITDDGVEEFAGPPVGDMNALPPFNIPIKTGPRSLVIVNPNTFAVRVGLRMGRAGRDITVRPTGDASVNLPPGTYAVYYYDPDRSDEVYRAAEVELEDTGRITLGKF